MSQSNRSAGDSVLISLASTMIVGYLTTRYRMFRWLWRFMPLLVVVSAWFLNRQNEAASESAAAVEPVAEPAA